MPRFCIIYNPTSNKGNAGKILPLVRQELDRYGMDYELITTQYIGHALELAKQAAVDGFDAVVADVVDCARHQGKTIMCFWDQEDVVLQDIGTTQHAFFVRVAEDKTEQAKALFANCEEVRAGVIGEYAFITESMTEEKFNDKAERLGILNRIRMEA